MQKLKADFNTACQIDETSNDSSSQAAMSPAQQAKEKESTNEEDGEDDEEEEEVLQFDFEASINAKKTALNSNGLPTVSSTNNLSQAIPTKSGTSNLPDDNTLDSCDKEKMQAIKNKEKVSYQFDMFASDEEYETVSFYFKLF